MKIMFTTIFDYPHTGGLSTHMTTLRAGLEELGHTTKVVSFSDISPIIRRISAQGPSFLLNRLRTGRGFVWSQKRRQDLLQSLLKEKGRAFDIINAQDVFAASAAISLGFPTVLTAHGYMAREAVSKGSILPDSSEERALITAEKQAYTGVDAIITVDKRIQKYIQELSQHEAYAIKNFINVADFQPDKESTKCIKTRLELGNFKFILLVPRRLTPKNGVVFPIKALPEVLKRYPSTCLVYAGDGEEMAMLKKTVQEQQITNHVRFLGSVPHEQMKAYFSAADIVLIPSIHSAGVEEATSIAALEAMGSGTPVIASSVGGLREIIDNHQDGLLVKERDIHKLADAIITILENSKLSEDLATHARQKIEVEHSHLAAAQRYLAIYDSVKKT